MSFDRLLDALDGYIATANHSKDDPARCASRELLIRRIDELLRPADPDLLSTARDSFTQRAKGIRKNPLNKFLDQVRTRTTIAWDAAAQQRITVDRYASFTLNEEDRHYAADLVARAEVLSYAFDRLCELSVEHFEIRAEMKRNQPDPHSINLGIVGPSTIEREERWHTEVDLINFFAHYEIKSLVDMLTQWGFKVNSPELVYISKTRDRFLAHPRSGGVMRMGARSTSIPFDGGPTTSSIAQLNSWGPIPREYYLGLLGMAPPIDYNKEMLANEKILLSTKHNHKLDKTEILRLKAFGLRDPNLPKAFEELADILESQALPKIDAVFDEAVERFGFERCS